MGFSFLLSVRRARVSVLLRKKLSQQILLDSGCMSAPMCKQPPHRPQRFSPGVENGQMPPLSDLASLNASPSPSRSPSAGFAWNLRGTSTGHENSHGESCFRSAASMGCLGFSAKTRETTSHQGGALKRRINTPAPPHRRLEGTWISCRTELTLVTSGFYSRSNFDWPAHAQA